MNLVVKSRDNIATILQWVTKFFSEIPTNKNYQYQNHYNIPPFLNRTGKIIIQECKNCKASLKIMWQTPGLLRYKKNVVVNFINRYLEHKGDGSILKYLKERSLATKLSHAAHISEHTFSLLGITIELSQQGLKKVAYVVKVVFEFLDAFKNISEEFFNDLWTDFIEVHQSAYEQLHSRNLINDLE